MDDLVRSSLITAYRPVFKALASNPELLDFDKRLLKLLDSDSDGCLTADEIGKEWQVLSAAGKTSIPSMAIHEDPLKMLFQMADVDGCGALSTVYEAPVFLAVISKVRVCECCCKCIDPIADSGYSCELCYSSNSTGWDKKGFDLCIDCLNRPGQPGCRPHGRSGLKHTSLVPRAGPPVLPLQLCITAGEYGVRCKCCGEWHDIVLSYLNPGQRDLHMRPDTGGTGFYCEFCAVRICSKCPQGNMQWKIKLAQPGMAAKKSRCWLGKCMGTGTFKGWNAVEAAARSRHAEHCRTCRAKLEEGAPLYAARPDPQPIPVLDLRKGSISSQPEYSNATKDSYSKTAGDGAGQDVVGGGSSSGFYQSGASADTAQLRDARSKAVNRRYTAEDAIAIAQEACKFIKAFSKVIPVFGKPLEGITDYVTYILDFAEAVPYNKAKARSLKSRAAMVAANLQGLFEELQSKLLDVSEEHQRSLSVALERLSNAMCKAKMLVARWANNQGANKLIRAVGRSVKNKMDIQDLRDVDNDISKCMTDLGTVIGSLTLCYQLQLQQELQPKLDALASAVQQAAERKDWASLQADLLSAVGGVEQLRQQLAGDKDLLREWVADVQPQLDLMGVRMEEVHRCVFDIYRTVEDIKGGMEFLRQEFDELKAYIMCMAAQQQGYSSSKISSSNSSSAPRTKPRLLIAADQLEFTESESKGEGAFAEVRKAKWRATPVAVKKLKMQGIKEDEAEQVYREALLLSHLKHPNIVSFYGMVLESSPEMSGRKELRVGLVMELCDCSLQDLLDSSTDPLALPQALNIALGIATGIDYLHNGVRIQVVHGDLKPPNVLIKHGGAEVKICDFGLSNTIAIGTMTSGGTILQQPAGKTTGTSQFMAPEVCKSFMAVDTASDTPQPDHPARDVYAFGMILYQLVTGNRPFEVLDSGLAPRWRNEFQLFNAVVNGTRPGLKNWLQQAAANGSGEVAQVLAGLIQRCWAAEPADRPTAVHVVDELQAIVDKYI